MINQEFAIDIDQQIDNSSHPNILLEFMAGLIFPIFSPTFYYHVAKRTHWRAVLFFCLFTVTITTLATINLSVNLGPTRSQINEAFATGGFPEITIANGMATIHAPEPVVLIDENRQLLVLDTTRKYTKSDLLSGRYDSAMLLTKTEIINLNEEGKLDVVLLSDLQQPFGSKPIEINARNVKQWLDILLVIFFILLGLWNFLGRLAYIAFFGLGVWGLAALFRSGTGFGSILTTGLYATVPALYAKLMLSQFDINFPLITLPFHFTFWIFGLICALYPRETNTTTGLFGMRSVRMWRILIALPILIDFALEAVFQWKLWYVTWPLALLTFVALIGLSLPAIINQSANSSIASLNEPVSSQAAQSILTALPSSPVALWTPTTIGVTIFFTGFPGGTTLSIINWWRMGMKEKAYTHLIIGMLGTFVFLLLVILLPGRFADLPALLINLGLIPYFRKQIESDIARFKTSNREVMNANGFGGFLIGLIMLGIFAVAGFVIAFLLTLAGAPIPE